MRKKGYIQSIKEFEDLVNEHKKPFKRWLMYLTDEYTLTKDGFRFRLMHFEDSLHFKVLKKNKVHPEILEELAEIFSPSTWEAVAKYQKLSWRFISDFESELNFRMLSKHQDLHLNTLLEFENRIIWGYVSQYQKLSSEIIDRFSEDLNWKLLCKYQALTEDIIEKYEHKISWNQVALNQRLTRPFIEKYKDKIRPGILYDNLLIRRKIKRKLIKMRIIWFKPGEIAKYNWRK